MKNHNDSYSYSRFSKEIGLPESNVSSHIIHGRRPLTKDAAKKITKAMSITKLERQYFLSLVDYINESDPTLRDQFFQDLFTKKQESLPTPQQDQMKYFSQWYYPVIGELSRLKDFECEFSWVKKNLWPHITPKQFDSAKEFLESAAVIVKNQSSGKYERSQVDLSPGHATYKISVSSYHQQMLSLAEQAISSVKSQKRNFSTMTLVLNKTDIKKAHELIQELQRKLLELEAESSNESEVYQINMQMFPFTQGINLWEK